MRRIEGKIELKMVVPEVIETRATITFYVKLGYQPNERFNLLQRGEDALEMKNSTLFKWHMRFKQGQKRAFKMALRADAGR